MFDKMIPILPTTAARQIVADIIDMSKTFGVSDEKAKILAVLKVKEVIGLDISEMLKHSDDPDLLDQYREMLIDNSDNEVRPSIIELGSDTNSYLTPVKLAEAIDIDAETESDKRNKMNGLLQYLDWIERVEDGDGERWQVTEVGKQFCKKEDGVNKWNVEAVAFEYDMFLKKKTASKSREEVTDD